MAVLVAMLRGINVGGHNIIKMEALRGLFSSLKFESPQTYVQSGNVLFKTLDSDLVAVTTRIQDGIEKKFACRPQVILRSASELRAVIKYNPFAKRRKLEPGKTLVFFLAETPARQAAKLLKEERFAPEELHLIGRELYIYFPNGAGKSKLPWTRIDKILQTQGTGRNWNSVQKILAMAEALETS